MEVYADYQKTKLSMPFGIFFPVGSAVFLLFLKF